MKRLQTRAAGLVICVVAAALAAFAGCADDETLNPSGSTCAVLSGVHASQGASIAGNEEIGGLSSYGFSAGANGEVTVTPPTSSDCGAEVAQRLQGLCATCEVQGDAACEEATRRLFDVSQTPIEACAACGDGVCSPGESAAMNDPRGIYCPEDCGGTCGDGQCSGNEALECPGGESLTCKVCESDCSVCGDDRCSGTEDPTSCPQDCAGECGDGACLNGEQGVDENAPLYCPRDCQGAVCDQDDERCNGNDRQICNRLGDWETVMCPDGEKCAVKTDNADLTECIPQ